MNTDGPVQDDEQHPVPPIWRPTLGRVVEALVAGDYALSRGITGVSLRTPDTAEQMRAYVADYGETLVTLPEATWDTSLSQWTGKHWEVLVDLFTEESRPSDLVMQVHVFPAGDAFRFEVHLVYVP